MPKSEIVHRPRRRPDIVRIARPHKYHHHPIQNFASHPCNFRRTKKRPAKTSPAARIRSYNLLMFVSLRVRMFLRVGVMFILVDRFAYIILSLVNLLTLLLIEMTSIGSPVIRSLVVDTRLAILDVASLTRRHLT